MKDLSKEERLNQRIAELEHLIETKSDEYSNKKWSRVKKTFFAICGVICFLLLYFALKGDINTNTITASNTNTIETIFLLIFVLPFGVGFVAGVIIFISYGVMYYITENSMREEIEIAKKIGELNALKSEKYNAEENE
jgi:hypothetical protein